jgi:uncharacterized protein
VVGAIDLAALLSAMSPELAPGRYVFATLAPGREVPPATAPLLIFREREGVTLVLDEEEARRAGLSGTFPCRMITLSVHSSLQAVGFLAAVTTRLAAAGLSVNPVSGYFHDHLFVPAGRAEDAMRILEELAAEGRGAGSEQRA